MRTKTLNKDIWQAFAQSKGRFISIMCLMMLGAFGLVGLKVMRPNVVSTGAAYFDKYRTFDLAVMSDYGLTEDDQAEINQLSDQADIEYGYFTDVTFKDSPSAIRLFSQPLKLSQFELVAGEFPSQLDEIALASVYQDRYQVGDQVDFQLARGNNQVLQASHYRISGFVNASEIISATNMGHANAGSGTLEGYGVLSRAAFDSEVHTIARISYHDLRQLDPYSKAYLQQLEAHQAQLDAWLADNGQVRLADIQAQAKDKIQDGESEIASAEDQLAQAESELASAKSELESHQSDLTSASQEIATKEAELESGSQALSTAHDELAATKQTLDQSYTQLVNGQSRLDESKTKIDEARAPLDQAKLELDEAKATIDAQQALIDTGMTELETARLDLANQVAQLEQEGVMDPLNTVPELIAAQDQLDQQASQLSAAQESLVPALNDYQTGLANYEAGMAQLQPAITQYEAGVTSLANRWNQYYSGLDQYQTGLNTYTNELATYESGQTALDTAKAEVESGLKELTDGQAELTENESLFEEEKVSAEANIKAARHEIKQAKNEVAGLSIPDYTTYTRRTLLGSDGYRTLIYSADGMEAVSELFPIVLYLVAALVTMTTMTRFVNEERTNAGVLKALGYDNRSIIKKFAIYGLVAGLIGTCIGIIGGTYLLPTILIKTVFKDMTIPDIQLNFYPTYAIIAILCAIACSVIPAVYIAYRELKEKPAYLLQPKPPVAGSTILLEKIPWLWRQLSFTQKVTARNIFRYKQRMLMTLFGVAGSVALLYGGLGITSSINRISERQYEDIIQYDAIIAIDKHLDEEETSDLRKQLDSPQIKAAQAIYSTTLSQPVAGLADKQDINLMVTESTSFAPFIQLYDAHKGDPLTLSQDGVIISHKIAKALKLKEGDQLTLTLDHQDYTVKVSGINELYAGHFIFMQSDYYQTLTQQKMSPNAYMLTLKDKSLDHVKQVATDFMNLSAVKGVTQNTAVIQQVHNIVNSLGAAMQVLTIVSILLAIVILYNLTNINVAERIRELSTIKVLGFLNKEVTLYIYRETIILSLIGIFLGLIGGHFFHRLLLVMVAPDNMMFPTRISWEVYLIPILVIVLIIMALGFLVNHKLKRVDMLEALKSVD